MYGSYQRWLRDMASDMVRRRERDLAIETLAQVKEPDEMVRYVLTSAKVFSRSVKDIPGAIDFTDGDLTVRVFADGRFTHSSKA